MTMTTRQSQAATSIAKLCSSLLATRMAERSNSARYRLFQILSDTITRHGDDISEHKYLRDLWRETGPFDQNERRFRHFVKTAAHLFGRSTKVCDIGETVLRLWQETEMEAVLDRAAAAMRRVNDRAQLQGLAEGVIREFENQDRLHRELARI
jgi:hypothetical protein